MARLEQNSAVEINAGGTIEFSLKFYRTGLGAFCKSVRLSFQSSSQVSKLQKVKEILSSCSHSSRLRAKSVPGMFLQSSFIQTLQTFKIR